MQQRPVNDDLPATTGALLRQSAARWGARAALKSPGVTVSYAQLDRLADRFAHAVRAVLPDAGRVAIMARNGIAYAAAHFGVARSGCQLAHLSCRYSADELHGLLTRLAPGLLLLDDATAAASATLRARLAAPPAVAVIDAAGDGGAALEAFVADAPARPPDIAIGAGDPFCIQFTGGTTGTPKGVVINHRARLVSSAAAVEDYPLSGDDTVAVNVPLCHAAGLFSWFQPAMLAGATALLPGPDASGDLAEAVQRHGVSAAFMVPTQLAMLLDDPAFAAAPLAGLRLIACGGAPTPPELLARCARLLPWTRLVIAYGSTETGHLLACPPEEHQARPGALGRPGPRVALAVCDAAGQPAAPGTVGEITSSGAHLMDGYLDDPGEDAAYFRSGDRRGWTGDLGRVDPDGVVVMAGRRKEMILCGGMNVFPAELELPLAGYPGIAECAAFGLPDPQWGELPALAVVPRPGAVLDPEALLAFCAERLARFKRPRRVVLVASLPRTAAGKVRRNLLAANCHAALTRNPPAHGEPGKESNA